ncbi:MAG: hypothetical protein ACI9FN_002646, partial [Saprospiraceae bacterium]
SVLTVSGSSSEQEINKMKIAILRKLIYFIHYTFELLVNNHSITECLALVNYQ